MYKGWKKLNKTERDHLSEMGVVTTEDLENTFFLQKEQRESNSLGSEPCWDCRFIEKKLGYET